MADYVTYANSCNIKQQDMVNVIKKQYPAFGKAQMSFACNPWRNALQLIPEAEQLLVDKYGRGPGLSITPALPRNHDNKNKPNRLAVRLSNELRSQVQDVYEQMCFVTMQDLLEAAICEFVKKYRKAA